MSDGPAPAGTPTSAAGDTTVITTSSGAKFRVAKEFVENFRGFLQDFEAAGGHIIPGTSGGLSERPNNASFHPLGRAIDINQTDRNVVTSGLPGGVAQEEAMARRWGLRPGSSFSNPDRGHYEVNNAAAAKAALRGLAVTIPGQQSNITATRFKDAEVAYSDVKPGWNDRFGASVPFRFPKTRPSIWMEHNGTRVRNVPIIDVGPWNITDDYWARNARPLVEEQFANKTIAQNGRVPTNTAAIDVTFPLDAALKLDGKGIVNWGFEGVGAPEAAPPVGIPESPRPPAGVSTATDAATQDAVERASRALVTLATQLAKSHAKKEAEGVPDPTLSPIDVLLGGKAFVGFKTATALVAYGVLTILQNSGIAPENTFTTTLSVLIMVLGGLGLCAKADRTTKALWAIVEKKAQ